MVVVHAGVQTETPVLKYNKRHAYSQTTEMRVASDEMEILKAKGKELTAELEEAHFQVCVGISRTASAPQTVTSSPPHLHEPAVPALTTRVKAGTAPDGAAPTCLERALFLSAFDKPPPP